MNAFCAFHPLVFAPPERQQQQEEDSPPCCCHSTTKKKKKQLETQSQHSNNQFHDNDANDCMFLQQLRTSQALDLMNGKTFVTVADNESRDDDACRRTRNDNNDDKRDQLGPVGPNNDDALATSDFKPRDHDDNGSLLFAEAKSLALQQRIDKAQAKLARLAKQRHAQKRQHESQIQELLLDYMPNNPDLHRVLGPMQPDLVETSLPNQVGCYNIGKRIGQGGFAQVYCATTTNNDYQFAVKIMSKRKIQNSSHLDRLANELRVLQEAHHANIVHCHQVLHGRRNIYGVMELGYKDLYAYKKQYGRQAMSTDAFLQIAQGLMQGLEYLHCIGVAHLDIKTENVLITCNMAPSELRAMHVQLVDFGLCCIAENNSLTNDDNDVIVHGKSGTLGFMCPEMVLQEICKGRQADLWSAGVTLLEAAGPLPPGWNKTFDANLCREDYINIVLDCLDMIHHQDDCFYPLDDCVHAVVTSLLQWIPENRASASDLLQEIMVLQQAAQAARLQQCRC